jgi:zinc finger protein
VCVPELDFEIPPSTNEGSITTIESILLKAAVGLEKEQPVRKALNPDLAAKLDMFIQQLRDCVELKQKFTFVIDDPAGNSYVENKLAPMADPSLNLEHYSRSEQQDKQLGANITTQSEVTSASAEDIGTGPMDKDEVLAFPTNCYNCSSPTETRMKTVGIHNFCGLL